MSLTAAMNAAVSGLTASGRGLQVVSDNIANALTETYGRRSLDLDSRRNGGVQVTAVKRHSDPALTANRRGADANQSAATAQSKWATKVEKLIGSLDDASSISGRLNQFEADLISAASGPESDVRLANAIQSAVSLVTAIQNAAEGLVALRQDADSAIAADIQTLNESLKQVEDLNATITETAVNGGDVSALLDERQIVIDRINEIVPVREIQRDYGKVALYSLQGAILVDGTATEIAFTATGGISPQMTYENGDLGGFSIGGEPIITSSDGPLGGGRLGANLDIRDQSAIDTQTNLDSFARDIIERFETLVPTGDTGLFTDAGGRADAANEVGLSLRIQIDSRIDPATSSASYRLRDGLGATTPGAPGDATLITQMVDALSAKRVPASGNLSSSAVTASGLASSLTSLVAADRVSSDRALSVANASQSELSRIEKEQGVNTDTELQSLIVIQRAYSANTRVISAIDEMLQELMRI